MWLPSFLVFLWTAPCVFGMSPRSAFVPAIASNDRRHETSLVSTKMLLNPVVAHLVAGSVAGAVGCGLAHPLDTIKTIAQTSTHAPPPRGSQIAQYRPYNTMSPNGLLSMEVSLPLTSEDPFQGTFDMSFAMVEAEPSKPNMFQVARALYQQEGLEGFFAGVQTMMIGQALIRAMCFTTNAAVMDYLQQFGELDASTITMLAAVSAGVTASFVVTPVERIKVMMQSNPDTYSDELQCIQSVLQKDGFKGFLTRGLGISLIREVPSVGLSFILYAAMMQSDFTMSLGSIAPLLFGAISGSVSCVPVYGIDCVKTRVQNTEGDDKNAILSPLQIAQDLLDNRGVSGFVDGLTPKMLRCAVLSAVSFSVYETLLSMLYAPTVL